MTRDLEWHENKALRRMEVAAPRMLDALKGLLAWAEKQPTTYAEDRLQAAARIAIAEAEGRTA
jgi:hypothetical protein